MIVTGGVARLDARAAGPDREPIVSSARLPRAPGEVRGQRMEVRLRKKEQRGPKWTRCDPAPPKIASAVYAGGGRDVKENAVTRSIPPITREDERSNMWQPAVTMNGSIRPNGYVKRERGGGAMYSGEIGQQAEVSTWLLNARRKRSGRRLVVAFLVALLEIGLLVALYLLASSFFPR